MNYIGSPEYPKVYRVYLIMRIVVSIAALLFGSLGLSSIIIYTPPHNILAGFTFPFSVDPASWGILLASIIALYIVFWPRVVLYADSIEMRGLFGTKKYLRSDIKGISPSAYLLLRGGNRRILIPEHFNYDENFKNWFIADDKKNFEAFSDENDAVLRTSKILGISKGKAVFVLFLYTGIGIGVVVYIGHKFPQIHTLGLLFIANLVGISLIFIALFVSIVIRRSKRKISDRK